MSSAPAGQGTTAPARRPDGSMSLLNDLMANTLDEGYAAHAARGASAGPRRVSARTLGAVLVVVLGLLTGTAVAQVRQRAAAASGVRTGLVAEVRRQTASSTALQESAAALRSDVSRQRDAALAADTQGRAVAAQVRALELTAAVTAVTGPGVVLTVDDAPPPTGGDESVDRGGSLSPGRVLDRDLQGVVNGLWAAGAEAIAIDGVRLSNRASIRSAGEAVLVDFRPLSPPYRIDAVGRSNALETGFVDSASGRKLQTLASVSGIRWSIRGSSSLTLPAATEPVLRAARAAGPS